MSRVRIVVSMSLLLLVGCSNAGGGSGQASGDDQAAAAGAVSTVQAKEIFTQRCSACHGNEGRGDGPGSATLQPKPRDFTDAHWQKTITDEMIESTIKAGGAAVGKSPAMPAHPDLGGKPAELSALRGVVRGFAKN